MFISGAEVLPEPLRTLLASGSDQLDPLSPLDPRTPTGRPDQLVNEPTWLEHCLAVVASAFNFENDNADSRQAFILRLPHVVEIARQAAAVLTDDESQLTISDIYNTAAYRSWRSGDDNQALQYLEKSLAIKVAVLGEQHADTANTYNNIAYVYRDLGDRARALEYFKKALASREAIFGADHPYTQQIGENIERLGL